MTHQAKTSAASRCRYYVVKMLRYRVKGASAARRLDHMARQVNLVWNFCNDTQRHAVRWGRLWPGKITLQELVAGSSKDLRLHSQTVQAICHQYVNSRTQARKRRLRYRGRRSLGWVPFNGQAIRHKGEGFRFMGHHYNVWLSRPVLGSIRCGSFAQDARGRWYINVCVDVPKEQSCGEGAVGIDLGLTTTATMSTGEKYDGERAFRAIEPDLAVAQRARKKNRAKALHAKARNRRLDGLHKLSTRLVSENKLVVVGNVNSRALAKTRMAKSVHDAGWGLLRSMFRYKAIARGAVFREVNEAYSSQVCSACGCLPPSAPKGLAGLRMREWACTSCGQGHDRDINAARNILALGSQRPAEGILAL